MRCIWALLAKTHAVQVKVIHDGRNESIRLVLLNTEDGQRYWDRVCQGMLQREAGQLLLSTHIDAASWWS